MADDEKPKKKPQPPFHLIYRSLLIGLTTEGVTQINRRTGAILKASPGPVSFTIPLGSELVPVPGNRMMRPSTAAAELGWMIQGTQEIAWLQKYTSIWDQFQTYPGSGMIQAAYGYRWRKHFGRDQLLGAIDALREDHTDRQVLVSAWDPVGDGLGARDAMIKNVPCPSHFALNIVAHDLHMALFIRSSDTFVGLPYDVMVHAMLASLIAKELNRNLGQLHVTIAHAHLYGDHHDMAAESLKAPPNGDSFTFPWITFTEADTSPDQYVARVIDQSKNVAWPEYNPRPRVIP